MRLTKIKSALLSISFFLGFCFVLFCFGGGTPKVYGGSQARGPVGATALAYITAAATSDLSHVFHLHHSSQQILNPLSEASDRTRNLMVPSRIRFCCAITGTPESALLLSEPF